MAKRRQRCDRPGCGQWMRHGYPRGRKLYHSLECLTGIVRRDRPVY